MATMEQLKTEENVLKLVEEHKREKQAAHERVLKLQQDLDAKQKLELEIQTLKGKLEVMKLIPGEQDSESKKVDELAEELKEKGKKLKAMQTRNTMTIEQIRSNDEFQHARKELIAICTIRSTSYPILCSAVLSRINDGTLGILCFGIISHAYFLSELLHAFQGFKDAGSGRANICIKRMGELDPKAFGIACSKTLSKEDAVFLFSELEAKIGDPDWYPFNVKMVDGKETVWTPLTTYNWEFLMRTMRCSGS